MYDYKKERAKLFTEDGVEMLTKIRDRVKLLLRDAGAFTMGAAIRSTSGDSWQMLACVDYLVEKGEVREVTDPKKVRGQDRVFTDQTR
jgi:hypothetical protein